MTNIKQSLAYSLNNTFNEYILRHCSLDLQNTKEYSIEKFSKILNYLDDSIKDYFVYQAIMNFCRENNTTLLEYYISNEVRPNYTVRIILESIERKLFQLSVTRFKDLMV